MTLESLNQLSASEFVTTLAGIYEHSPWVAEAVLAARPFADVAALATAMANAVAGAGMERQLALIRAHPELAGRAAVAGDLTAASKQEQRGAGLDACTPEEFADLQALNAAYRQRFDFPFIIAVKGHSRASIIAAMRARLDHDPAAEFAEALRQIDRIAGFRIAALLG